MAKSGYQKLSTLLEPPRAARKRASVKEFASTCAALSRLMVNVASMGTEGLRLSETRR